MAKMTSKEINSTIRNTYIQNKQNNQKIHTEVSTSILKDFDTETAKIQKSMQDNSNTNELLKILITEIRDLHKDIINLKNKTAYNIVQNQNNTDAILNYLSYIYKTQCHIGADISDINNIGINTYEG